MCDIKYVWSLVTIFMKLQRRVDVMVCLMVIVSFIMVNLQPYVALFVFLFMAATLHSSLF